MKIIPDVIILINQKKRTRITHWSKNCAIRGSHLIGHLRPYLIIDKSECGVFDLTLD